MFSKHYVIVITAYRETNISFPKYENWYPKGELYIKLKIKRSFFKKHAFGPPFERRALASVCREFIKIYSNEQHRYIYCDHRIYSCDFKPAKKLVKFHFMDLMKNYKWPKIGDK